MFSSDSGLCFIEASESFRDDEEHFAQFVEANRIEESKQRAFFLSVVGAIIAYGFTGTEKTV